MLRKIAYRIAIALILLTPFMYSDELYNGVVTAKQFWFYGAMALLMLVTALDLLFDRKPFTLQFNKIDLALLAFYTYYTIRAATTPYMPMLHNQRWTNWTLCMVLYLIIKRVLSNERMKNEELRIKNNCPILNSSFLILNFLILTALVQSIWGLLQLYDFLPSFNSNFKITGTFFNPAPYAMYLAVIFPLALGQIMKNEKLRLNKVVRTGHGIFSYIQYFWQFFILHSSFLIYYLSFATVIAILLVLPATMIRAAWLGALAGALIVLQFKYHYIQQVSQFLNTRFKKTVAMAVAAVIIASLGTGIFFLKKDSANGKLFIWEVTLGKIVEKPLFGYGVGRFEAEYNNWQAEYFQNHPEEMVGPKGWVAGNTKYCFNEFLEMASEIGGTGLLLFVCLLVLALGGVPKLKLRKLENEGIRKVEDPLILNSFIASFLFIFFFSFPFYNLPLLLAFFGILAVISSNKQAIAVSERTTFISRYSLATSLLFLVIWFAFELHQNQAVNEIWQKASNLYSANAYDIAEKEYEKAYTSCKYNNEFLQQYGKCLAMNKNFTKAQITLSEANKFGGDYMLFANLGDVYKELKQYPQAEIAYKYAACMIPHKLYPHYLLAKLYLQSGNKAKAVKKAKEILAMNVKVENGAVSEIEKEMKKIIAQFNKEL